MSGESTDNVSSRKMIKSISVLLTEILNENKEELKTQKIQSNNKFNKVKQQFNVFNSKKVPSISLQNYFERIVKYSKLEDSTLIITLVYIDRLCDITGLTLYDNNIHRYIIVKYRIILGTVILAIKYNEDDYYDNEYYAKVGGISLAEINALEYECIKMMNHKLFIEEELYAKYNKYLKQFEN
jgi:hypothetical protein